MKLAFYNDKDIKKIAFSHKNYLMLPSMTKKNP